MIDVISVCLNFNKHTPDSKYKDFECYLLLYKEGIIGEAVYFKSTGFSTNDIYESTHIDDNEIYAVAEIPKLELGGIE